MDPNLTSMLKLVGDLGLVGLVIYMWWADNKRIWKAIDLHKQETAAVMAQYQKDMAEQREMYRANASLCRDFSSVAEDLRDIVTLNIQAMTTVTEAVKGNQFCPMVRLKNIKQLQVVEDSKG